MQRKTGPRPPLDWDDVRLFLALCRAKTLGGAAQALGVDASTISRRLATLEEILAVSLFDRGRDGISASEAAEDLLPVAEEMEAVMMRFSRAADGLEREVSGIVRLTCPPDLAEVALVPSLGELLTRYPALRIEIAPGEAIVDLSRREADLALRTARPAQGDLWVTRLTSMRWILVASPALAKRIGRLRAWSDARWITWGERLAHIKPARWLSNAVPDPDAVLRSDSLVVQLAAVKTGLGVALVPEPSCKHYGLVPVKLAGSLRAEAATWPTDELFLVTHRALRNVPRVRVVWDFLIERLASAPLADLNGACP